MLNCFRIACVLISIAIHCGQPPLHADPGGAPSDNLLGVEVIDDPLPFHDGNVVRYRRADDGVAPLEILLSRSRYWAQDGHLDVVAELDTAVADLGQTELRGAIVDDSGTQRSAFTLTPPGSRLIFFPRIPDAMTPDGRGTLELEWLDAEGRQLGTATSAFRVETFQEPVPSEGSIILRVPNDTGATEKGVPVTVGVPFPRGTVTRPGQLQLFRVKNGESLEIPMQVTETARWSKFGSLKWVHCDFNVDLDGRPVELELRYGPDIQAKETEAMKISEASVFPVVDAGRLRIENGVWFDAEGDGEYLKVLEENALHGGFVEHEDGRLYQIPADAPFLIEETGPRKTVIRREGWYVDETDGTEFCRYIIRYIIHRDSPVLRIFQSWFFTGDGNRDRIRNMGWRFPLAPELQPGGFLTSFEDGRWAEGDYLLQYDYEHFEVVAGDKSEPFDGGRAPGVARAEAPGVGFYFGTKDFWQNYPSELEFRDGALWFHNWPRHNRPSGHTFAKELTTERGEPAAASSAARYRDEAPDRLTLSEWRLNAVQSRHAHEGEVLDFRLPEEYGDDPIWVTANDSRPEGSPEWFKGEVESVNAQGVSRTEEMWIYLTSDQTTPEQAAKLLAGLNRESVRAIVDPQWVAESGTFFEVHPQDWENFPEEERIYELTALSPAVANERLGIYGMWIYGDIPAWGLNLERKEPELYRALRKRHLQWPYPWLPFARSGDLRLLKSAEAATRQVIDSGYCHYVSDDVRGVLGPVRGPHRQVGLWDRGLVPWAARGDTRVRGYEQRADFLLDAWYLVGYHRAHDQILAIMEMIKPDSESDFSYGGMWGRQTQTIFKTCLQLYEATQDPWFLAMAHAISHGHREGRSREHPDGTYGGRLWDTSDREFLRYTDDEAFKEFYLDRQVARSVDVRRTGFNRRNPMYPPKAFAWKLTGDDFYLRRTVNAIDTCLALVMDDPSQPDYLQGVWHGSTAGRGYTFFTPTHLRWFPHALWAVAQAGERPPPVHSIFVADLPRWTESDESRHRLTLASIKAPDAPLVFNLALAGDYFVPARVAEGSEAYYRVTAPDGETVLEGVWSMSDRESLEVSPGVASGVYQLELRYPENSRGAFDLPATETGRPEIVVVSPDETTPSVGWRSLWFEVPEGVENFRVLKHGPEAVILDPEGNPAWSAQKKPVNDGEPVSIQVVAGQSGKLWQAKEAGHLQLGPEIPPFYAVEPDRWFAP